MSDPKHPVYTFRANLQTVNVLSHLPPDRYDNDQDRGLENALAHKSRRSTWIPGLTAGENRVLSDGGEITVSGLKAQYIKDVYTVGDNPILELVP